MAYSVYASLRLRQFCVFLVKRTQFVYFLPCHERNSVTKNSYSIFVHTGLGTILEKNVHTAQICPICLVSVVEIIREINA